ncbi:MAG: PIN domain-containing protein [Bacteroidia bacterium]|nr:PIN domain-containing protein [Bacteroidia bacterium]
MAKTYRIHEIPQLADRSVLFDANVLIYNFWPSGNQAWEAVYSRAFGQLLHQGNPLYVSLTILSEVINRALRLEYNNYLQRTSRGQHTFPFKKYRDSSDGQQMLSDIYDIVRDTILLHFTMVDQCLSNAETISLLTPGTLDFNDAYIVKLCQDHSLVLLTNDSDFKNAGLDLLSSNHGL